MTGYEHTYYPMRWCKYGGELIYIYKAECACVTFVPRQMLVTRSYPVKCPSVQMSVCPTCSYPARKQLDYVCTPPEIGWIMFVPRHEHGPKAQQQGRRPTLRAEGPPKPSAGARISRARSALKFQSEYITYGSFRLYGLISNTEDRSLLTWSNSN